MGKSCKAKRQNNAQRRLGNGDVNWIVKPLIEPPFSQNHTPDLDEDEHDHDHDHNHNHNHNQDESNHVIHEERPETSSTSNLEIGRGRIPKSGWKHRAARPEEPMFGPEPDEIARRQVVDVVGRQSEMVDKGKAVLVVEADSRGEDGSAADDVFTTLQELRIGVGEIDLSLEHLKLNDQLQQDELLAMESIYGENVHILEKVEGLRSFQIQIHIELPSEYSVSAKLNHTSFDVDVSDEFSYTFKVQYLSPILLTCLLPRSYPSHSPPFFTLSVQWLHESGISRLCSMLDSLWNEQPAQEILYQWVQWLHSSSLPHLGFGEGLVLGPYGFKSNSDRRALSGSVSPDADIPSMRTYNEGKQHENFLKGLHQCSICFSEYAGTEFVRLPCHHFFCVTCMKTYAEMHVMDGTVNRLQCPIAKCEGMMPPVLLKKLLGEEEFVRWETLLLQKTLDSMSDVAYCPRCETACLEDEEHHAQCSKCFFSFCSLCRERRHVGIQCMTPEVKLRILQERQNSGSVQGDQRKKERDLINELLSVKEILRDAKQCPMCKMAISRIEGCNKMVCANCQQYFCYRCNKKIDGYDHFRDGGCELFPQAMIAQWEERLNERQRVAQVQAQLHALAPRRACPTCRQAIAKLGNNNHIFCFSCQTRFCYLCGKVVRHPPQHFGPKGCKQHTTE